MLSNYRQNRKFILFWYETINHRAGVIYLGTHPNSVEHILTASLITKSGWNL
jgi:hypothetical protein